MPRPRSEGAGVGLASREAGRKEAEEPVRDGPPDAAAGGGWERYRGRPAGLALDPLMVPSQHTHGITAGLARGAPPPFDPPEQPRSGNVRGWGVRPRLADRSRRPVAGCPPTAPRSPPVKAVNFHGRVCVVTGGSVVGVAASSAPVPPGLRDGLRPSLRRGRAPSQPGKVRVVRGVTRPGPALDEGHDRALGGQRVGRAATGGEPSATILKTTFVFPSGLASDGNTKGTGVR